MPERKEAEKEGKEGQVSSACQEKEEVARAGVGDWMTKIEERKARVFMEMRGYKEMRRSELEGVVEFLVKAPRREETILMWCASERVGVELLRRMLRKMNAVGVKKGMIIAHSGITSVAQALARERGIELIPKDFPSFNIFKHILVPVHEVLTEKEREVMLKKYRVKVYQLPRIAASDMAVIAIGGRPGDVIRIVRDSPTAGKHVFYRHVV